MTQKIREAAALFDIQIADHLIVGQESYFSFADAGWL
jgi:DNA repair protein RadC